MESENIKIDTEKIETQRVSEIHADEFSSVEKELNQRFARSCHDIRQFGSTTIPADVLSRFLEHQRCGLNSCSLQTLIFQASIGTPVALFTRPLARG